MSTKQGNNEMNSQTPRVPSSKEMKNMQRNLTGMPDLQQSMMTPLRLPVQNFNDFVGNFESKNLKP
jgi:hypothetical protein